MQKKTEREQKDKNPIVIDVDCVDGRNSAEVTTW